MNSSFSFAWAAAIVWLGCLYHGDEPHFGGHSTTKARFGVMVCSSTIILDQGGVPTRWLGHNDNLSHQPMRWLHWTDNFALMLRKRRSVDSKHDNSVWRPDFELVGCESTHSLTHTQWDQFTCSNASLFWNASARMHTHADNYLHIRSRMCLFTLV